MPEQRAVIRFSSFRLDLQAECLWQGANRVDLRPKAWMLLRFMAQRPGLLMTRDELLDAVWGDVTVTVASLNQAILELRRALGDNARKPRFIETVHRRGFRFIAACEGATDTVEGPQLPTTSSDAMPDRRQRPFFGREAELDQLDGFLAEARAGRRQTVFITGEPGIGKTSIVRVFLDKLTAASVGDPLFIGGGQCIEHIGEVEAYLPALEALDRFMGDPRGGSLRDVLRRFAPTWLIQLPWLLDDQDEADTAKLGGTPARMLREFCVAIEALAEERPVVLWLEDLHWGDPATIDLLSALARRRNAARILMLATYRPVDAAMTGHPVAPLARALLQQDSCHELALELFDLQSVEELLRTRFDDFDQGTELAKLVHDQTDGNPLFVVTLANHMVAQGWIVQTGEGWQVAMPLESIRAEIPGSLREIVDSLFERMVPEEVSALEAASVVGETFAAQAVAAVLDVEVEDAETLCGQIAGWGRFLSTDGTDSWLDGTRGQRYRFVHHVYPSILYERIAPARRQRLHLRLARRLESSHVEHRAGPAAAIAFHYERGGDPDRAIHFLELAAQGVHRRFADREAVAYLERAIGLLGGLPAGEQRIRREFALRRALARSLIHAIGFSAHEQAANVVRASNLVSQIGGVENQLVILGYQMNWNLARGNLNQVRLHAEEAVKLAAAVADPVLKAHPQMITGIEATLAGALEKAEPALAHSVRLLENVDSSEILAVFPLDFTILSHSFSGWSAWLCGRPDEARIQTRAARERATTDGTPFGIAMSLGLSMAVEFFCRNRDNADDLRQELESCLDEYGIPYPYAMFAAAEGWLLIQGGTAEVGIERIRRGMSDVRSSESFSTFSLLLSTLAEAELARGAVAEGLAALDEAEAFVENTGERFWEAEIHRLRGELLRLDSDDRSAEDCLQRSLRVAQSQGARSLELRATISLASLWRDSDRGADARTILSTVCDKFSQGFDTGDLRDAKSLLTSL